ncbi:putative quinol monooxygenase [Sphingomonas sp. PP-CE-1G-424]|jgi:quinol monooxygenase YgiN|uniref:putative quinol monooxygenase n=1 Tax=Sphingomonas sp. PP-CE-1G-424 TaxID=2135658 RepID=UPI001055E604|nr:putative quinol monooxygenase [Sphingomonas sp. PP-CE-1G-424]TCP64441.1 quinol monooxygenase YgiN [Sphingomonas sp. PP-CE-1G-424]
MTDTPTILIYATYRTQSSDVEAFQDIASRMASAARLRDGCVFLDVTKEVGADGTFRLIEAWRDQAALSAHLSAPDFQAVFEEAGKLGIVDRRADCYSISGRAALEMLS